MDTRNVVVLVGRLTGEPVLKYLPNGTPVTNFSIAVNRSVPKQGGGFEDELDGFFDCEIFGGTAVAVAELAKGALIQLQGTLQQRKYTAKNGTKVNKVEIRVRNVGQLLIGPRTETPVQQTTAAAEEKAPQPA